MRNFSEFEKDLIRYINSEAKFKTLPNFLDPYLVEMDLVVNFADQSVCIAHQIKKKGPGQDEIEMFTETIHTVEVKLCTALSLLERLVERGFLIAHNPAAKPMGTERFGNVLQGSHEFGYTINDESINHLFCTYAFRHLTGLPDLVDLQEHDFVFPEDRQFQEQLKVAQSGVDVAKSGVEASHKGVRAAYVSAVVAILIALGSGYWFSRGTQETNRKLETLSEKLSANLLELQQINNGIQSLEQGGFINTSSVDFPRHEQIEKILLQLKANQESLIEINQSLQSTGLNQENETAE